MRVWTRRYIGMMCLNILLAMGTSCSSSQQEGDDLETSQEQGQEGNQKEEGNQEATDQEDQEFEQGQQQGEGDDLQEIINEMDPQNANNAGNQQEQQGDQLGNNQGGNELGQENNLGQENMAQNPGMNQTAGGNEAAQNSGMNNAGGDSGMAGATANNAEMANSSAPMPSPTGTFSSTGGVVGGASGTAAAPGLPEIGSKLAYVVRPGDTLGRIATRIYGNSAKWTEIAEITGLDNPSRIYPGDIVYYQLSEDAIPFASANENAPREELTVEKGDTLATIAQRIYGSSNGWRSIWRQNDQINNPNELVVGQTIYYVPQSALTVDNQQNTIDMQTTQAGTLNTDAQGQTEVELNSTSLMNALDMNLSTTNAVDLVDMFTSVPQA